MLDKIVERLRDMNDGSCTFLDIHLFSIKRHETKVEDLQKEVYIIRGMLTMLVDVNMISLTEQRDASIELWELIGSTYGLETVETLNA